MQREFWLERWEKNEIGFHEAEGSAYLREFWTQIPVAKEGRVFVPLCGKSKDLIWLRDAGHEVIGCEIIEAAVRDFFKENALTPHVACHASRPKQSEVWSTDRITIIRGDFFELDRAELGHVSAVFDRASLIALPPSMRERYANKLVDLVSTDTEVLLVTLEYDQTQMKGPPFAVHESEIGALYGNAFHIAQLARRDMLDHNPRFRDRGVQALHECIYRLTKRK